MKMLIPEARKECRTPSWGAWIEILKDMPSASAAASHPLVGCVD